MIIRHHDTNHTKVVFKRYSNAAGAFLHEAGSRICRSGCVIRSPSGSDKIRPCAGFDGSALFAALVPCEMTHQLVRGLP
jgi:hypothetical protein